MSDIEQIRHPTSEILKYYFMNWIEMVGYLGSFLTSITFIPQVYKSWQSKSVGDLSIWMILIVVTSTIVWLVYGFAIESGPVIVANCVVLALTLLLLYFKLSFKKDRP